MERTVCVIGLGKLGACIAACFADKGVSVVGVDINEETVRYINRGHSPIREPGLEDLIARNRARLRATSDHAEALQESDVSFIVVPTPSQDQGGFSLRLVVEAANRIGAALKYKNDYHLVVLTSTVLPGSTEHAIIPILEQESGKRCGVDFGVCYSPEFIALGTVIHDFFNPDLLLIGESDEKAGALLMNLYKSVCDNDPPVARMNFVNAELAKLSLNAFVTMKITFANMLAELCENLPGGDVDAVTGAIGLDRRIGTRYFQGSMGYGGPCFPRDNLALAYVARQLGCPPLLAQATDAYNRSILNRIAGKIQEQVPNGARVAILGLAYKADTDVIDESPGLQLAERLADLGLHPVVYDPLALDNARRVLGNMVEYAPSVESAVANTDLVVIANRDREFESLALGHAIGTPPRVLDAWRLLRRGMVDLPVGYSAIGLGDHQVAASEAVNRLVRQTLGAQV